MRAGVKIHYAELPRSASTHWKVHQLRYLRYGPHETCKTPKTSRPFFAPGFASRSFLGLITTSPQCFGTALAPLSEAVFDDAAEGMVTTTGGSLFAPPCRAPEFERGRVARGWR